MNKCTCGNPSEKYYGPHEPDCEWWTDVDKALKLDRLQAHAELLRVSAELARAREEIERLRTALNRAADIAKGVCPKCGQEDSLHSAAIDNEEAVSCTECQYIVSYKDLRDDSLPSVLRDIAGGL